jgi:hypothetical protein
MNMTAYWDIVLCSLVEDDQCFRGVYCLHHQVVLMMEAVGTSETLVNYYKTTSRLCQKAVIFILTTMRTRNLTLPYTFQDSPDFTWRD